MHGSRTYLKGSKQLSLETCDLVTKKISESVDVEGNFFASKHMREKANVCTLRCNKPATTSGFTYSEEAVP